MDAPRTTDLDSAALAVEEIGRSAQQRPLRVLRTGHGRRRLLVFEGRLE